MFINLIFQLSVWISEKHEIACDDSYRELTNLQGKVKKHEAFEAELKANKDSLDKLHQVVTDCINFNVIIIIMSL